jgi:hypothetical protein
MGDRPEELEIVDRLKAATEYNHFYAFRLHRNIVELDGADDHARILLAQSAAILLEDFPALIVELRTLGAHWSEVELLDPANLDSVTQAIEHCFAELDPKLQTLITRQEDIVAELIALLRDARRS